MQRSLQDCTSRLSRLAGKIESLSPLAVLARGYTITQKAETRSVVRDARELNVGDAIITRFVHGETVSKVERID